MRIMTLKFLSIIFVFIITSNAPQSLKKNKYLSTRYNEVNLRNGPGLNQLILYKILARGYPLKIKKSMKIGKSCRL